MEVSRAVAAGADDGTSAIPLSEAEFIGRYRQWRDPVYRYLRARCPTDDDAADLTASAFERAWRARHTFRGPTDAYPGWIFGIARRLAVDAARRRRTAATSQVFWPLAPSMLDPADLVSAGEDVKRLAHRLADLSDLQREALALRFGGRLTATQIGAAIGKSEAATQKLLTRALARLKEAYRDDE